jgi:hypothetical protein
MTPLISIIIIVLLGIGAVIRNIDWRGHAVRWVGNNPSRSQHYIEAGDTVHTIEGHRILMSAEGMVYTYDDEKVKYVVDIPKIYPYKYIRGRRIVGQSDGELVANPLGFYRREQLSMIQEGLTETSALAEGSVVIAAVKSVKSNKAKGMLIYLLIGIIAVGGYMYYRSTQKDELPTTANVTQNMTAPAVIQPGKIIQISPVVPIGPPSENNTMPPIDRTLP